MERKNRTEPIDDLISESTIAVVDAYERGVIHGMEKQNEVNKRLADPKNILRDFITFVKGFKLVIYDDVKMYSNGEHLITDESLISNFLMRTDYEEKD